jgi:hypothetical protein
LRLAERGLRGGLVGPRLRWWAETACREQRNVAQATWVGGVDDSVKPESHHKRREAHGHDAFRLFGKQSHPGVAQLPDHLSVNPDGLSAASAELDEQARQLGPGQGVAVTGRNASSVGAASASAAIASFNYAYAARLDDCGRSGLAAAAKYANVDDDRATDIESVSV